MTVSRAGAGERHIGSLVILAASHRFTPIEVRERLAEVPERWARVYRHANRSVLLTTCNRFEVYAWTTGRPGRAIAETIRALAWASGLPEAQLAPCLDTFEGQAALVHLVRVVTGLDSLVIGEEQISGQVRDAYRQARECATLPRPLDTVFSKALEGGRRIRQSTLLGKHPSVAAAAVAAANRLPEFEGRGLAGQLAVVIGAGAVARSAAQALVKARAQVTIANRTVEHAAKLARDLGGGVTAVGLDGLPNLLASAALVIGATASRHPLVIASTVSQARATDIGRPLLLIDLALPRNIDPLVRDVPGVRLVDLDHLDKLCPVDFNARSAEIARAARLVVSEAEGIARALRLRSTAPAIAELRRHAETLRLRELERSARRLKDLTPEQRVAVDALTRGLVNKLLHAPTMALRDAAVRPSGSARIQALMHDLVRTERTSTATVHNRTLTAQAGRFTGQ